VEYSWSKESEWQVESEWLDLGNEPVMRRQDGRLTWALVCDRLGSVRAEVTANPSGRPVVNHSDHWPYGEAIDPTLRTHEGHRYTAQWREYRGTVSGASVLDGLDFMHAREYDWRRGRFLEPDPIGSSWNAYAYALGNPVNFVDPFGLSEVVTLGPGDMPVNLANAGPIDAGFGGEITVTAKDPGWSPEAAYMYLVGLEYNDWLRTQGASTRRGYADYQREMVGVSKMWMRVEHTVSPYIVGAGAMVGGAVVCYSGAVLWSVSLGVVPETFGLSIITMGASIPVMALGSGQMLWGTSVVINQTNILLGTHIPSPSDYLPEDYFPRYPSEH